MSERSQSGSVIVASKIGVLAIIVVTIGLPINDRFDYAILVAAAVVVFVGATKSLPSRWLAATGLAAMRPVDSTLPDGMTPFEMREAYRALKGHVLRIEIFDADADGSPIGNPCES